MGHFAAPEANGELGAARRRAAWQISAEASVRALRLGCRNGRGQMKLVNREGTHYANLIVAN